MDVITEIFDALGGPTRIADATGNPVQTVHGWKVAGRIPRWHRKPLLKLRPLPDKALSEDARSYLLSDQRGAPSRSSRPSEAAAAA